MKIGIITANYDRPHVFRMWCASIKRLRGVYGDIPVVVTSEKEDIPICEEYDITHVVCKNKPLSRKFNRSMLAMKKYDPDYVMVLGSDDIVSNDLFGKIRDEAERGYSVIAISNIYYFSPYVSRNFVKFSSTRLLGVCRTVHKKILSSVDWTPWNWDRGHGLDANMWNNIRDHVLGDIMIVDGMVVDVKTKINMNSYNLWASKVNGLNVRFEDEQEFLDILSEEELEILTKIKGKR